MAKIISAIIMKSHGAIMASISMAISASIIMA
jgi:hypothetical protein